MKVFKGKFIADWYTQALETVVKKGQKLNPRNKPNLEIRPVTFITQEWAGITPGVNYKFACAEALDTILGLNDVSWLEKFRPGFTELFSDDGKTTYGNYGHRLVRQYHTAARMLREDPDSRQAVLSIWRPEDLGKKVKDLPCNTHIYLKVRNNCLHLTVFRRSADIVWGVPYDHHVFWALLYYLADRIRVYPGTLTEVIDSLHVYLEEAGFYDWDRVQKALKVKHKELKLVQKEVRIEVLERTVTFKDTRLAVYLGI